MKTKNILWAGFLAMITLVLTQCTSTDKRLPGIWQLEAMEVNGSRIEGKTLGNFLWEFNDEGGYLFNVAGAVEKGRYKLNGKELKLQSVTYKDRPETVYEVNTLDSVSMKLTGVSDKNTTYLYFVKIEGESGEKE